VKKVVLPPSPNMSFWTPTLRTRLIKKFIIIFILTIMWFLVF
jgi:hypothetical protein